MQSSDSSLFRSRIHFDKTQDAPAGAAEVKAELDNRKTTLYAKLKLTIYVLMGSCYDASNFFSLMCSEQ